MKLPYKHVLAILVLMIVFFAALYWGGGVFLPDFNDAVVVQVDDDSHLIYSAGAKAPYFELSDINQNQVKLSSYNNQPLVILFWSTWNSEAADQLKIFDDYLSNAKNDLVKILAIDSQEERSVSSTFVRRGGYQILVAVDSDGAVTEKYGIKSLPTIFFIDREGVIREVSTGVLSEKMIGDKMEQLIK